MAASVPFERASFVRSVAELAQLPADDGVEVAFAGRSNAGKSSALNALTGRRGLARTSKRPGRTQLINLFAVGAHARLVDLPGYGHADVPARTRRRWTRLLTDYLATRHALAGLVLVVDIRRGLGSLDWELLALPGARPLALHLLLTKADKLGRGAAGRALDRQRDELEAAGIEATLQIFSATHGHGIDDLRELLGGWLTGNATGDVAL